MKKQLIFLLLFYGNVASAQQKKDLLDIIDQNIDGIESVIKLSDKRLVITAGDGEFDPEDQSDFENDVTADLSDTSLAKFFNNQRISNHIVYPYSIVAIHKDEYDLLKLLGQDNFYFMDNPTAEPVYTPKTLKFRDGSYLPAEGNIVNNKMLAEKYRTTVKDENGETYEVVDEEKMSELEKEIWNTSSFNEAVAVLSPKPIAGIRFEIKLPSPAQNTYTLDTHHRSVESQYGTITLDTIAGRTVHCTLPSTEGERDIQIKAYYKDGRRLAQKGHSSNTIVSDKEKAAYVQFVDVLKTAREKVKSEKIKTSAELEKYVKQHTPYEISDDDGHDDGSDTQYLAAVYSFSGPVSCVEFVVKDTAMVHQVFEQDYIIYYNEEEKDYVVAGDWETEKNGIINNNGEWVVKPQFEEHFRMQNRYFYWDQFNDKSSTYRFDPQAQTIEKVPYQIDDPDLYGGRYMTIEPETNGPVGVVDGKTGKIIIPMQHSYLHYEEPGVWVGENESNKMDGAYRLDGSILLPFEFNTVKVDNGFFYTMYNPTERSRDERNEVYNSKAENITKGRYGDIEGTFSDGLLLVKKQTWDPKEVHVITSTDYFYIDQTGKEVLSFPSAKYHSAEPFREGLAKVEKRNDDEYLHDGDYGFVDTKGKVIIPYMYDTAYGFHDGHAYVEIRKGEERTCAFIDRNNKIVKKLNDSYQSSWRDEETGKWLIRLWNGDVYDYTGNKVK